MHIMHLRASNEYRESNKPGQTGFTFSWTPHAQLKSAAHHSLTKNAGVKLTTTVSTIVQVLLSQPVRSGLRSAPRSTPQPRSLSPGAMITTNFQPSAVSYITHQTSHSYFIIFEIAGPDTHQCSAHIIRNSPRCFPRSLSLFPKHAPPSLSSSLD